MFRLVGVWLANQKFTLVLFEFANIEYLHSHHSRSDREGLGVTVSDISM